MVMRHAESAANAEGDKVRRALGDQFDYDRDMESLKADEKLRDARLTQLGLEQTKQMRSVIN